MFINWAAVSDAHHQNKHGATETQIPAGQSRQISCLAQVRCKKKTQRQTSAIYEKEPLFFSLHESSSALLESEGEHDAGTELADELQGPSNQEMRDH